MIIFDRMKYSTASVLLFVFTVGITVGYPISAFSKETNLERTFIRLMKPIMEGTETTRYTVGRLNDNTVLSIVEPCVDEAMVAPAPIGSHALFYQIGPSKVHQLMINATGLHVSGTNELTGKIKKMFKSCELTGCMTEHNGSHKCCQRYAASLVRADCRVSALAGENVDDFYVVMECSHPQCRTDISPNSISSVFHWNGTRWRRVHSSRNIGEVVVQAKTVGRGLVIAETVPFTWSENDEKVGDWFVAKFFGIPTKTFIFDKRFSVLNDFTFFPISKKLMVAIGFAQEGYLAVERIELSSGRRHFQIVEQQNTENMRLSDSRVSMDADDKIRIITEDGAILQYVFKEKNWIRTQEEAPSIQRGLLTTIDESGEFPVDTNRVQVFDGIHYTVHSCPNESTTDLQCLYRSIPSNEVIVIPSSCTLLPADTRAGCSNDPFAASPTDTLVSNPVPGCRECTPHLGGPQWEGSDSPRDTEVSLRRTPLPFKKQEPSSETQDRNVQPDASDESPHIMDDVPSSLPTTDEDSSDTQMEERTEAEDDEPTISSSPPPNPLTDYRILEEKNRSSATELEYSEENPPSFEWAETENRFIWFMRDVLQLAIAGQVGMVTNLDPLGENSTLNLGGTLLFPTIEYYFRIDAGVDFQYYFESKQYQLMAFTHVSAEGNSPVLELGYASRFNRDAHHPGINVGLLFRFYPKRRHREWYHPILNPYSRWTFFPGARQQNSWAFGLMIAFRIHN